MASRNTRGHTVPFLQECFQIILESHCVDTTTRPCVPDANRSQKQQQRQQQDCEELFTLPTYRLPSTHEHYPQVAEARAASSIRATWHHYQQFSAGRWHQVFRGLFWLWMGFLPPPHLACFGPFPGHRQLSPMQLMLWPVLHWRLSQLLNAPVRHCCCWLLALPLHPLDLHHLASACACKAGTPNLSCGHASTSPQCILRGTRARIATCGISHSPQDPGGRLRTGCPHANVTRESAPQWLPSRSSVPIAVQRRQYRCGGHVVSIPSCSK